MPERASSGPGAPSPSRHFLDHLAALGEAARIGPVLDLACGRGRHTLPAATAGLPVVGLDRNQAFLSQLRGRAAAEGLDVPCVRCDLESGNALPFTAGTFGAILVFRYLHRPLAASIEAALAPGGLLLYETFTRDQLGLGHGPSNPRFLLDPGELPRLFSGLVVEHFEECLDDRPRPDAVARLSARKPIRPSS